MKRIKHNKYKNTGLLFEILSKMVVSELLNNKNPTAYSLIRKYFNPKTELFKELSYYHSITNRTKKLIPIDRLVDVTIKGRNRLNLEKLNLEKFKLIGELKAKYSENDFFANRVQNYKIFASVYKLFEGFGKPDIYPDDIVVALETLIEHDTGENNSENTINDDIQKWRELSPDLQVMSFKMLLEKFNKTYSVLQPKQRELLRRYIYDDVKSTEFRDYVYTECKQLKSSLTKKLDGLADNVLRIKLSEAIKLIDIITTSRTIQDNHLTSLLKYYELNTKL